MKIVVDMDKENFKKALEFEEIRKSVEFFISQEYSQEKTLEDFMNMFECHSVVEIMDTTEFDVDRSFARLLDKRGIFYSKFVLIDEDNIEDDRQSILDAKEVFDGLDIYSEFQKTWVS